MKKMTLSVKKHTDQTVVFSEVVPENDPFAFPIISNLYINKRDLSTLGLSSDAPRLEVTIKAVA